MPYFGESTAELVYKCSGRGDNSWSKLMDRIHALDTADAIYKRYSNRLYEIFQVDKTYDLKEVISSIGTVRRELGLKIEEQTAKWYLQELSKVFLVEKIREVTNPTGPATGYKILFQLMPALTN